MTDLRDAFAIAALPALIDQHTQELVARIEAGDSFNRADDNENPVNLTARNAYIYADAMLKAREGVKNG
jgi:hypothetical protein